MTRSFSGVFFHTTVVALSVLMLSATGPAVAATIVVELEGEPAARQAAAARLAGQPLSPDELQARRDALSAAHDAFLADVAAAGIAFAEAPATVAGFDGTVQTFPRRYTLVFNGMALDADPAAASAIAAMPGVKAVHADRPLKLTLDRSVAYVGASALYGNVHELNAGDDVREGLEGHGIHIAVIDSGIDWSHPMFGGEASPPRLGVAPATAAAGSNDKVIYYLPLADGALDDFGHGTHVAATSAGYVAWAPGADGIPLTADDPAVHGVAPQARLMGYKACNASGSCLTTDILTAIEDAVSPRTLTGFAKPVAHVINMSLGGSGGPDSPTSVAADNAALLGAIVVAAAGNEGPGDRTLGAPGAGRRVIAVAASNDPGVYPNRIDALEDDGPSPRAGLDPIRATLAPDSNAGLAFEGDLIERYVFAGLADTPDQVPASVVGRICLVERGSTAEAADNGTGLFGNKAAQCQAKGAIAAVIFNNEPGDIGPVLAPAALPVFTISREDGLLLHETLGYDAEGVSVAPIRLGPQDPALFDAAIAGFSSRGPVEGFGQVKPDVAAPGVDVLAATTMVGAPAASMQDASRYTVSSGTSMATPHVAGAAALIKQAHPGWDADRVRALLINTATNPRDAAGNAAADGPGVDRILEQGGGLIDVAAVVHAKGVMGVAGDGLDTPSILASHSFGLVPVIDSRVVHSETVVVQLHDLAGESVAWNLGVADNRGLDIDGVTARVIPQQVTPAADGFAEFTVEITVDGDRVREALDANGNELQLQWFVHADRADGAESLRMPFYMKPIRSIPLDVRGTQTDVFEGIVLAGDTGLEAAEDVTFVNVPFDVDPAAFELDAVLEFDNVAGVPDLDFLLFDANGVEIGASATEGGPEHIEASLVELGTYTYRVVGWANGPTPYTITSVQQLGGSAPTLDRVEVDYDDPSGTAADFDGDFTIVWIPAGGELAFEIEVSTDDGASWETVEVVAGDRTSVTLTDQSEGLYVYRIRGHHAARIGVFVTAPSAERRVQVDRRTQRNITSSVSTTISNVSFVAGVFEFDMALTNDSTRTWYPLTEFSIHQIKSKSKTVRAANADNGGGGNGGNDRAYWDFSAQLGADDVFTPDETTGARRLRFHDPAAELFTFKAKVTAYHQSGQAPPAASDPTDGEPDDPAADEPGLLDDPTGYILQITCEPITGAVIVEVIEEVHELL